MYINRKMFSDVLYNTSPGAIFQGSQMNCHVIKIAFLAAITLCKIASWLRTAMSLLIAVGVKTWYVKNNDLIFQRNQEMIAKG